MPQPTKDEKKQDFISRCVSILLKEGKKKDEAIAICFSLWENKDNDKSKNTSDK